MISVLGLIMFIGIFKANISLIDQEDKRISNDLGDLGITIASRRGYLMNNEADYNWIDIFTTGISLST
jgi:hypothetical protein